MPITFFCTKINLSIMNDTVTIYPNRVSIPPYSYEHEVDLFLNEQSINARMGAPCLQIKHYITRMDEVHEQHHQDGLDREQRHHHVELVHDIDSALFAEILQELVKGKLITDAEQAGLSRCYEEATSPIEEAMSKPLPSPMASTVFSPVPSPLSSPTSLSSASPRTPLPKVSSFSQHFFSFAKALGDSPILPFFPKMPS